eukprot:gene10031-11095_t
MFLDTIRYALLRHFYCPLPLPRSFPILGGKSLIEVLVAAFVIVISSVIATQVNDMYSGTITSILGLLCVIFAMRSNFLLTWLGFTFHMMLLWHKVLGIAIVIVMFIHGFAAGANYTGVVLGVLCGLSLLTYAIAMRLNFDLFFYPHIIIFLLIAIFSFLHDAPIFGYSLVVWGGEVLIRLFLMQRQAIGQLSLLDEDHVLLSLPKKTMPSYTAGQYCFLMIKQVNIIEFHPFTIASTAKQQDDESISFIIKASGDWTKKLVGLVSNNNNKGEEEGTVSATTKDVDVFMQGPYGGLTVDFMNADLYKGVLLIAGGVGIAACLPLYKQLLAQAGSVNGPRKVMLIWASRHASMVSQVVDMVNKETPTTTTEPSQAEGKDDDNDQVPTTTATTTPRVEDQQPAGAAATIPVDVENQVATISEEGVELTQATSTKAFANVLDSQFHVYLSQVKEEGELPYSSLSSLPKDQLHSGRPQMNLIFSDIAQAVKGMGGSRVAVMVCGPASMVFEVKTKCDFSLLSMGDNDINNNNGIRFDCQEEYFEF